MNSDEFTLSSYRALIDRTKAQYQCRTFDVLGDTILASERYCLLRHDIDMSPSNALKLARIEADAGVRATYTILLTGEFYNPLETAVRDTIRQIGSLGHDIGLHFDAAWHGIDNARLLEDAIRFESNVLGRISGTAVGMFSFHNTTPFTMACHEPTYGGLWNAYAGELQKDVSYLSDSNGCWLFRTWSEGLEENPDRLQVLTHPEWWTEKPLPPAEKISRMLDQRSRETWRSYCDLLKRGTRVNRSDVPEALAQLSLYEEGEEILRHWLSGKHLTALTELRWLLQIKAHERGESIDAETNILAAKVDELHAEPGGISLDHREHTQLFERLAVAVSQIVNRS